MKKKIDNKDVCLTFDDSLKCQIDVAFPILKKKKIQAFFFLYTNAFTSNPSKLEIFRDFRTTCYKKIDFFYKDFFLIFKNKYKKKFKYFEKNFDKKYLIKYPFYTINDKKFRFSRDKVLSVKSYESLMQQLMLKKKYNYANAKKKLLMSTEDVKKLIKNNQIIGLHSHSHLGDMSQLNYRKQLIDYKKNISFIKEKFKLTPNSMSHPFGRYNFNTLRILKANGIKIGFLSHLNKGKIQSNLEIPRLDHMYIGNKIL